MSAFDLSPDVVTVWRVALDVPAVTAPMEKVLSPDETERAARYHFDRDRRRFIVARAVLRFVLGRYLHAEPPQIAFDYGPKGKPSLANRGADLRFNVAHSHEVALIAVAHGREVGVDIEFVRPMTDCEQLVARNFSAAEIAAFRSLPESLRQAAFFAGWTRKEAYLKARGGGLSIPLDSFTVSLGPDEPAALLDVHNDSSERARWEMANLSLADSYAGALVVEGVGWRMDRADWNG